MRNENFLADLHNFAQTVLPIMTEFGMVTEVGRSIGLFLRGQSHPSPDGAGPSVPPKNGTAAGINVLIKSIFNTKFYKVV